MKRLGRPTKPATAGRRVSLGLRVTAEIKNKLDDAARASGRTQSHEAECRLERSFGHEEVLSAIAKAQETLDKIAELAGLGATVSLSGSRFTRDEVRALCEQINQLVSGSQSTH